MILSLNYLRTQTFTFLFQCFLCSVQATPYVLLSIQMHRSGDLQSAFQHAVDLLVPVKANQYEASSLNQPSGSVLRAWETLACPSERSPP